MNISPKTKIDGLLKLHPFLIDFLPALSPKFEKLKNPVLRRTIGKVANLGQVADFADYPLEKLLMEIASEIRKRTAEEVEVEKGTADGDPLLTKEERIEVLKDIIRDLHRGENLDLLRKRFARLVKDVSSAEISEMEQKLIDEGMPVEEVKRLCDIHVQVFKESLEGQTPLQSTPGHPLHTLMEENRALENIIARINEIFLKIGTPPSESEAAALNGGLQKEFRTLAEIEKHYLKKENQLFPVLEKKGVTGPSKVMWGIHDEIRAHLKELQKSLKEGKPSEWLERGRRLLTEMSDMIYKEEKILFPMSLETLGEEDWARVKRGEEEIGYAWIPPGREWRARLDVGKTEVQLSEGKDSLRSLGLEIGELTAEEVNLVFIHLPVDITYVREDDTVAYYSQAKERIFPRSPAIIGRTIQNCHPPDSVHVVNKILEAFRAGKRDVAEFWIQPGGKFIHIRYFAVRDKQGKYKGCLEVSQDVTAIKKLEGTRRLLDWD